MSFWTKLRDSANPVKAVQSIANVFKPGGSVLGKLYDETQKTPLGGVVNAGLHSSSQLVKSTSGLVGKIGGRGKIGDFGRHWEDMANRDTHDRRRTFINGGKVAGTILGGMFAAPAAAAAAGGGTAGAVASGATMGGIAGATQGTGLEGIAKGAALGGATAGITSGLGDAPAYVKGAASGAVNAAARGDSIAEGALTGGVSSGVGSVTSSTLGGGSLADTIGKYVGARAAGEIGSKLTGGQQGGQQQGGQSMPTNSGEGPNWDAGQVLGGLGSLYQGYEGAKNINGQLDNLNSLFSNDSPYAKTLEQTLTRRDAASGRRSQYGPRSVELQAKLAEQAARLAPTIADLSRQKTSNMNTTVNSGISALRQSGMLGSLLKEFPTLGRYFNGGGGMPMADQGIAGTPQYNPAYDRSGDMSGVPGPDTSMQYSPQMDEFNTSSMPDWYDEEYP
jgi:hypothetical protein